MPTPIALILLALAPSPSHLAVEPGITDLAWLRGDWRQASDRGLAQELWSQPDGDNMVGVFRWQRPDGSPMVLEILILRQTDAGLHLRYRHFDADLTPWKSEADGPIVLKAVRVEGTTARFENAAPDADPSAVTYTRDNNQLRVDIDFSGDRNPLRINFALAD